MKYWLLFSFFLYSISSLAVETYEVTKANAVSVITTKGEEYLNIGDSFSIGEISGWKRSLSIIKTSNPFITDKNVVIGNNRFNEIQDDFLKKTSVKTGIKVFEVTAPMKLQLSNGKTLDVVVGDRLEVGSVDGWKRNVKVIQASTKTTIPAHLGNVTYQEYLSKKKLIPESEKILKVSNDPLDNLINSLLKDDEGSDVDEYSQYLNSATCPENNKTFKLAKAISIISMPGKMESVPEESVIQMIKSEKGACYLKVLKLPDGSSLSLDDYPKYAVSYPVNFPPENLEEITDFNSQIKLEKGVNLKLTPGLVLKAIGRKTGKSYNLKSDDNISIVGIHKNGDYIIKRNGERHEYRVSKENLEELNHDGALEVNLESTVGDLSKNDSFNQVVTTIEIEPCSTSIVDIGENDTDIEESWEACVVKDVKTKDGRTIKANNYLANMLGIQNYNPDKDLKNSTVEKFSNCIARSMKHGTNRNTASSCSKDAKGNIESESLRVTKKNSKGVNYTALKDTRPRACASKKTSTYLAKRFLDAAKCLDLNPKEMFPIINHESHFQPTAVSPTFALGVGQIVYDNYRDFYDKFNEMSSLIKSGNSLVKESRGFVSQEGYNKFAKSNTVRLGRYSGFMLSHLQDKIKSKRPECSGLKRMYENPYELPSWANTNGKKFGLYKNQENERLCSPKNPDESFYISMIYYQYSKKHARFEIDQIDEKLSSKMGEGKKEAFSKILGQWMYNGGGDGILNVLEIFNNDLKAGRVELLNDKGIVQNKKLSSRSLNSLSESEFKKYLSHYIKYRYGNKSQTRRDEVAKYVPGIGGTGGIDGDLKKIEKEGAGICGE